MSADQEEERVDFFRSGWHNATIKPWCVLPSPAPTGVAEIRSKYPDPGWNEDLDYTQPVDNQVRINIQAKFNEPEAYDWLRKQDLTYTVNGQDWLNVWNGNFVSRSEHHFLGGGPYQRALNE